VDGSVVNLVAILPLADSKVIPMSGKNDILIRLFRTLQDTDDVLRIDVSEFVLHLNSCFHAERNRLEVLLERFLLEIIEIHAGRFEQLNGNITRDPALKRYG